MINAEFDKYARMHHPLHSGQPYDKASADGERNFWMTAQEAMEYGIVDQILMKRDS